MVSSGMKVPQEVEEAGSSVVTGKSHSAVVIDLDANSNTLSVKKSYSNKLKHPFRACLAEFQSDKASFALVNVKLATGEGQERKKLVMVMWAPDEAPAKVMKNNIKTNGIKMDEDVMLLIIAWLHLSVSQKQTSTSYPSTSFSL